MAPLPHNLNGMMRLGEAAAASGLTTAQLQYYVMVGVVRPSGWSQGRQRLFDLAAIERIKLVTLLNRSGYPLREIREIFTDPAVPAEATSLRPTGSPQ